DRLEQQRGPREGITIPFERRAVDHAVLERAGELIARRTSGGHSGPEVVPVEDPLPDECQPNAGHSRPRPPAPTRHADDDQRGRPAAARPSRAGPGGEAQAPLREKHDPFCLPRRWQARCHRVTTKSSSGRRGTAPELTPARLVNEGGSTTSIVRVCRDRATARE